MSTGTVPPTAPPAVRRQTNQQSNRSASQFVPKIPGIETLGTSTEQRGHDFAKFIKSIHHHALTNLTPCQHLTNFYQHFCWDPLYTLVRSSLKEQTSAVTCQSIKYVIHTNYIPLHTSLVGASSTSIVRMYKLLINYVNFFADQAKFL